MDNSKHTVRRSIGPLVIVLLALGLGYITKDASATAPAAQVQK